MRNMHKWQELRPEEFNEELARVPIVYLACGPMEDHGLQNALGIDPGKAYEICLRAAGISGGIVFPLLPVAPAGSPIRTREEIFSGPPLFPPSLFFGKEVCEQLYGDLFAEFARIGFKVCAAFGGHGPAASLLGALADERGGVIDGMHIVACGSTTFIRDVMAEEAKRIPDLGRHGGMWETAMNMALCEDYVDVRRTRDIDNSPIPSQLKGLPESAIRAIERASVEFGEKLIQTAAERLAARTTELLGK